MAMNENEEFEFRARAEQEVRQKPQKQGLFRQGWDLLGKPEQMSRQGLEQVAGMIPNPEPRGKSLIADVARGTPRVLGETLAEAAPGFVSRGAILTGGAIPALRGMGKAAEVIGPSIAGQLESLSGMKPGLLGKAFRDPSLFFSKIPQEARDAYQASSQLAQKSQDVSQTARPLQLVMKLLKNARQGMVTPDEALAGRKAIDQLWESKSITEDFKNMARTTFDQIAKIAEDIKEADTAFSRGKQAAGLRQLFPQNKYGGTSAFKTAIMAGLNEIGLPGKIGMSMMSPAMMGAGATGLGALAKVASPIVRNPGLAVSLQQLISRLIGGNTPQQPQGSGLQ